MRGSDAATGARDPPPSSDTPSAPAASRTRWFVLDTGAIMAGMGPAQAGTGAPTRTGRREPDRALVRFVTTPQVAAELSSGGPTGRALERDRAAGLELQEGDTAAHQRVHDAARASGDAPVLSRTDTGLVALAVRLQTEGHDVTLWSEDHALRNVARALGIANEAILARGGDQAIRWYTRCTGCGRHHEPPPPTDDCPICGSALKRTRKPPPARRDRPVGPSA